MKPDYKRVRLGLVILMLGTLAACQTTSNGQHSAISSTKTSVPAFGVSTAVDSAQASPVRLLEDTREAADLRVFLADSKAHPGWTPVPLKPSGVLYVRTDAIIDRNDLMGIQSATDQAGSGLLVLVLKEDGLTKLRAVTAANPGLRLALVVGQVMLAAPAYTAPIQEQQLAFPVGSASNAEIAARSVAGAR